VFLVGVPAAQAARTLYLPGPASGSLSAFAVGTGSALTLLTGSPQTASGPEAAVLTPDGKLLFLTESSASTIARFAVAADGSLTPLGKVTGTGSTGAMSTPQGAAISPHGTKL
jgi:6-phosphogluconolactonase (cycloisomerase 2 family)